MALILFLSSMSKPPLPLPPTDWEYIDKFYHFIAYTGLGILLAYALANTWRQSFFGSPWLVAPLIASLFGASDEWYQSFVPGRYSTVSDWVADSLGGGVGTLIVYSWYRLSERKAKN